MHVKNSYEYVTHAVSEESARVLHTCDKYEMGKIRFKRVISYQSHIKQVSKQSDLWSARTCDSEKMTLDIDGAKLMKFQRNVVF